MFQNRGVGCSKYIFYDRIFLTMVHVLVAKRRYFGTPDASVIATRTLKPVCIT